MENNYELVQGNETYIKVIAFPPAPGAEYAGESMWVLLRDGDRNNGTGWVNNNPVVTDVAVLGSLVAFGGGTDEVKPFYIRTIEKHTDKFGGPGGGVNG